MAASISGAGTYRKSRDSNSKTLIVRLQPVSFNAILDKDNML
jgi:hypothetical protein